MSSWFSRHNAGRDPPSWNLGDFERIVSMIAGVSSGLSVNSSNAPFLAQTRYAAVRQDRRYPGGYTFGP